MKLFSNRISGGLTAVMLAGGLAVAGSAVAARHAAKENDRRPAIRVPVDETEISRESLPSGSYAPVVDRVAPAVVKIVTKARVNQGMHPDFPGMNDPFWRRFFGDPFGPMNPRGQMQPQFRHGLGSGVIVTEDGYILTNNHVVDGANEVKVSLQDGREFNAEVIGRDPKSDLAVVKIDASDLPTVTLADSDNVQIGDVTLAIGNPFGVGQTVTSGIVSATQRGGMGIEAYEDFIQTDAAINPGNSGGALVDVKGRLIGINTAILSRSGGNHGVGFAIPSNLARNVMESLIKDGRVTRGYLGVAIQNLTPELAEQFEVEGTHGALVGDVAPDSPADAAGLKSGDVVVEFNGRPVTDSRRLQLEVAQTKPGSTVPVQVLRDGKQRTLKVTVKQLAGQDQGQLADSGSAGDTGTLEGVGVADLTAQHRARFKLPKELSGAVITQVAPGSAAAEAGLQPGDVIQEINREPVESAEDAIRLTEKSKDNATLVRVWGPRGGRYVVVDETAHAG